MNGQELSTALRGGKRVFGTCILAASSKWPAVLKNFNLDFVFIDTEHNPIDRDQLGWMCRTYAAMNIAPLVRIPRPDPYQACMILDGGAHGIIAPYVETVEEVQALRGAIKWRPLKGQRLQHILTGQTEPEPEIASYLANWNANSVFVINIESQPALDRLDDLLAVPQLDAVLVGPHDLSINLGIPEQYEHPRFKEAIATIIRKAREFHVGVGIHYWLDIEQEAAWIKAGANFVVHSTDVTFFGQGLAREFRTLRSALGESEMSGSSNSVVI
jgi:2-keto-3-deoxy-L-rhamnonate aldolase RhmA